MGYLIVVFERKNVNPGSTKPAEPPSISAAGAPVNDPFIPTPSATPQQAEAATEGNSTVAVVAAIIGNILVGAVKFVTAALSGSAAMLSEGIHSIVDSGNGILVLFGIRQSRKAPDESHPFGYGKELYFWTMVVAVLIFMVGGGVSLWEGISHLRAITPDTKLGDPTLAIAIILIAGTIEGITLGIALREFNKARGDMGPIRFIEQAKDPSLYTVVLEDTAAETGLIFALCGVVFSHIFDNPYIDVAASILISFLLMGVAVILLTQTKKLLVGEGLNKPQVREIVRIVEENPYVVDCGRVLSMYMGPKQLLITIDANFNTSASVIQILQAIDSIEAGIRAEFPDATRVFIEVESLRQVQAQAQAFEEMESEIEEELLEAEAEAARRAEEGDDDEDRPSVFEMFSDFFSRDDDDEDEEKDKSDDEPDSDKTDEKVES